MDFSDHEEGEEQIPNPCDDLDENGFPILPPSSPDEVETEEGDRSIRGEIAPGPGSFASEFYRAGMDWSRLVENGTGKKKALVQRDLFQMWGIVKKAGDSGSGGGGSGSKSSVPPYPPTKRIRTVGEVLIRERRDSGKGPETKERKSSGNGFGQPRACPFYKKMPGTPFTVDAFRYGCIDGCLAYFLSHFHADHYGGLSKKWSHGPIYCTPLTARLVKTCLSVNSQYISPLEIDTEHVIEGIKVTMLEANHCPGAALIHFHLPDGRRYLHTGDFRASKLMQSYPRLLYRSINVLYLDTTYCNPKYRFPSKEDVVHFVVQISQSRLKKQPKTLVIVGAYSIGKEHVYVALSQALGVGIYTTASRSRILKLFNWPELTRKLCSHGSDSPLHVLPMAHIRHESLKQHLEAYSQQFTSVLAFRPTGWTFSESMGSQLDLIKPSSRGNITIYGVPYSEHSSFTELKEFVQFLKPETIVPTVNVGNKTNREKMQSYFREWLKS